MTDKAPERIWAFWTPNDMIARIIALEAERDALEAENVKLRSERDKLKEAEAERDTERLAAELFATKDSAARARLLSDKAPEFIWAIDKVDLGQYVHRDTHQALEAKNVKLHDSLERMAADYLNCAPEAYKRFAQEEIENGKT